MRHVGCSHEQQLPKVSIEFETDKKPRLKSLPTFVVRGGTANSLLMARKFLGTYKLQYLWMWARILRLNSGLVC